LLDNKNERNLRKM